MRERLVYLADTEAIPNAGVFIKNIDLVDPITAIDLIFEATTGATSCDDHEIHDDITRIEVVDGGDVLHSVTMLEEMALNCYERGQFPWFTQTEMPGIETDEACHIMFGRTPRDEEINLDPKKFLNPQLRITYALTISATAGFATGTGYITAKAHVLEEAPTAARGFFLTKEHYNWQEVANQWEYIDMPCDFPYRLILLKALLTTNMWEALVNHVILHGDRKKFVKIDLDGIDIIRQNFDQWTLFWQKKIIRRADDAAALLDLYHNINRDVEPGADDHITTIEAVAAEQVQIGLYNMAVPGTPALQTAPQANIVTLGGLEPHSCACMLMGDLHQIEDWWDVTVHKSIELAVQATAVGGDAAAVVIQQLRS